MHPPSRLAHARWAIATLALGLLSTLGFAQTTNNDPQQKFDAIQQRYRAAQREFQKSLSTAKEEEVMKLYEKRPGLEFLGEFKALALEAKGTDVGARCWMQVAELGAEFGKTDDTLAATKLLTKEYIQSAALEPLPELLAQLGDSLGPKQCEETLRDLAKFSPHKKVQAAAVLNLAEFLIHVDESEPPIEIKLAKADDVTPRKLEAHKLLERLQTDFADVSAPGGESYKTLAAGQLFVLDNLQIGKIAPEFEVVDENGVRFKLTDYRGKVVVLDFWGNWWGPCRAMLPHEKALVKRFETQPFALIGINSDGNADQLKEILKKNAITWRQAVDGSTSGPLATKWNVHAWPTIYVLDANGVIRYRDVRDQALETAVTKLLDELKK